MAEKEIEKLNGKVSVIVPVYNTEKYLRECIESIRNMSYPELEVILVDDGSMDSSGLICDEYSNKDKRVKVIHKPNGGLSSARNAGLDIFSGEFLRASFASCTRNLCDVMNFACLLIICFSLFDF